MIDVLVIILFCIGLWGLLSGGTIIRKIIGLTLLNSAVVILFVLGGRLDGDTAPILTTTAVGIIVDPIPQALMLTAIVVGLAFIAVALILAVKLHRLYGTLDVKEIEKITDDSSD